MDQIICKVVRDNSSPGYMETIRGPLQVADLVARITHEVLGDSPNEAFMAFHLNAVHAVVGWEILTRGTLDTTLVHPREIFRSAIVRNAASIILAHNHPSGSIRPSEQDKEVTRNVARAGHVLGIPVLDHVIVGRDEDLDLDFFSFARSGLMPNPEE